MGTDKFPLWIFLVVKEQCTYISRQERTSIYCVTRGHSTYALNEPEQMLLIPKITVNPITHYFKKSQINNVSRHT